MIIERLNGKTFSYLDPHTRLIHPSPIRSKRNPKTTLEIIVSMLNVPHLAFSSLIVSLVIITFFSQPTGRSASLRADGLILSFPTLFLSYTCSLSLHLYISLVSCSRS